MYHWKRELKNAVFHQHGENVKSENVTAVCKGERKRFGEICRHLIYQVDQQITFVCVFVCARVLVHVCIVCVHVH